MKRDRQREGETCLEPSLDFDVLSGRHRKRISSRYMPGSCMFLPPVRFRYRHYLPIRLARRCSSLCVHRNTYTNSWESCTEMKRRTCSFGSTHYKTSVHKTSYTWIGGARSENEVRHERWSMLDYNADGTCTKNDKECDRLTRLILVQSVNNVCDFTR